MPRRHRSASGPPRARSPGPHAVYAVSVVRGFGVCGVVDELVVDGVGEEVRRAWGDRPRAAKCSQGHIADVASRSLCCQRNTSGSIPTGSHSPKCGCDPPGSNCRFTQALGGPAFLTDGNEWHVRVSHRSPSLSLSALSIGALCSLSQSCQSVT